MSNLDTQLATITTTLEFIQKDIAEIKEAQKNCPIHDLSKSVDRNTAFRQAFLFILGLTGVLGVAGTIIAKVVI